MKTTSSSQGEWRIAEASPSCAGCAHAFAPGQAYFSGLEIEAADAGWVLHRNDYCETCWPARLAADGEPIYWKMRRPEGEPQAGIVDLNSLLNLFLQLLDDVRPEVAALRYVVGLLLVRKRILKQIRNAGGARGDLVFKDPRDLDKRLRLETPDLSEDSLTALKEQLGAILG